VTATSSGIKINIQAFGPASLIYININQFLTQGVAKPVFLPGCEIYWITITD
jgi:hypothetical protein